MEAIVVTDQAATAADPVEQPAERRTLLETV
jgi:hypothetical protein